ncbi:MAG: GTP pyrophosphokinase [Agathobaculum sp.]|jgi:putative GTP pyrophosphokinase|uniref:GTP pyrophosphokinase n=1 Tax=Agathobaculum sp. TaxID=2048138 RepID=UPI003D9347BB
MDLNSIELSSWLDKTLLSDADMEKIVEAASRLQQMMMLYEAGIREIKTKLDILKDESRVSGHPSPIDSIKSRIKSPHSIVSKLRRYGFPVSLQSMMDNLNDIGGIRVICPFIEDIYTVADMLMRQDDLRLIAKKDYIQSPKPNGYRSLHLILEVPIFLSERTVPVRIELQLRTIAMDFWASLEHQLRYKSSAAVPQSVVDDLKSCADVIAATDEKMQRIARELHKL